MNEHAALTDLIIGAQACSRNSERLLSDAEELLGKNGNISSFLLYLSALEELGKGFILAEKVKKKEPLSVKKWKDITTKRGHQTKLSAFYRARDSSDEMMVRAFGLNYAQILEKMAKSQGDKARALKLLNNSSVTNEFQKTVLFFPSEQTKTVV